MENRRQNSEEIDFLGWFFRDGPNSSTETRKTSNRSSAVRTRKKLEEQYENCQVTGFTNDEVDEFRQIFEFYDVDNQKVMDLHDLEPALRALGYNPSLDLIKKIIDLMTVEDDATVDFMEFCVVICLIQEELGRYGALRDSFRFLDHNRDGTVEVEELLKMLTMHGDKSALKDAKELIKYYDPENIGKISYENFIDQLKIANAEPLGEKDSFYESSSSRKHFKTHKTILPTHVPIEINSKKQNKDKTKTKLNQGKVLTEPLNNSVARVLGGPVMLTSAVIITVDQKQVNKKKNKSKVEKL